MRAWAFAIGLVLGVGCSSGLCEERGGRWYPGEIDPKHGTCQMPTVDGGQPCTEPSHCHAGYCACAGADVPDGQNMTGACPSYPAHPSDGVLCTVVDGVKHSRGLNAD